MGWLAILVLVPLGAATAIQRAKHRTWQMRPFRHRGATLAWARQLAKWNQDNNWATYGLDPEPSRLVVI